MNLYPDENQPGAGNNFVIAPIENDRINQWDVRMDYAATQKDQFFVRYSQSGRKDVRPAPLPGLANGGDSSTGVGHEDTNGASVGYTRTFTPRVVNELGLLQLRASGEACCAGMRFPPPELRSWTE
jgi:hypothetical protein